MFHKSFAISVAVAAVFTGCAAHQPSWQKEGSSAEIAKTAHASCKYHVTMNKIAEEQQKELVRNCMEGKGYRWR